MPGHDLIVIGASAGGVEAVSTLVAGLPPDLAAAVCVVVHLRPYLESRLPDILRRAAALPVEAAVHGAPLRPGTIHVAVPDLHLIVEREGEAGVLRVVHGPRENRSRPAVDPLFRSAAAAFGPRVIAVVMSGALDDGTAGLWAVKERGGIAVVQDPADAAVSSMPATAHVEVGAHHVATARELGPLLGRLVRERARETTRAVARDQEGAPSALEHEVALIALDEEAHQEDTRPGEPSRHVCPDCGGVLWDVSRTGGGPLRFRCETGHAYAPACLAEAQTEELEYTLWAALRALEDRVELARVRAVAARDRGVAPLAAQFEVQEQAARQHASALRAILRLHGDTGVRPRGRASALAPREHLAPEAGAAAGGRSRARPDDAAQG